MSPLLILLLGGGAIAVYKKTTNPAWSPISSLLATPSELRAALARVRATSVPTPTPTSGLDPNMTSAHVDAANHVLVNEVKLSALRDFASAADKMGFENTAHAVHAKADAVADASAKGASAQDVVAACTGNVAVSGFDLFAHGVAPGTPRPGWGGTGTPHPKAKHPCTAHDMQLGRDKKGLCTPTANPYSGPATPRRGATAPMVPHGGGGFGDGGNPYGGGMGGGYGGNPYGGGMGGGGFGGAGGGGWLARQRMKMLKQQLADQQAQADLDAQQALLDQQALGLDDDDASLGLGVDDDLGGGL